MRRYIKFSLLGEDEDAQDTGLETDATINSEDNEKDDADKADKKENKSAEPDKKQAEDNNERQEKNDSDDSDGSGEGVHDGTDDEDDTDVQSDDAANDGAADAGSDENPEEELPPPEDRPRVEEDELSIGKVGDITKAMDIEDEKEKSKAPGSPSYSEQANAYVATESSQVMNQGKNLLIFSIIKQRKQSEAPPAVFFWDAQ